MNSIVFKYDDNESLLLLSEISCNTKFGNCVCCVQCIKVANQLSERIYVIINQASNWKEWKMIFFPITDTLKHFCFTSAWGSSTHTFYPTIFFLSPNGIRNREQIQQNALFFRDSCIQNKDCHVKISVIYRATLSQRNVRLPNWFQSIFHHIPGPARSP